MVGLPYYRLSLRLFLPDLGTAQPRYRPRRGHHAASLSYRLAYLNGSLSRELK
jgi:hypothetical protein